MRGLLVFLGTLLLAGSVIAGEVMPGTQDGFWMLGLIGALMIFVALDD